MNFKRYAVVGAGLFVIILLLALLGGNSDIITPNSACDFMKSQNLITDGYKSDGMGGYFCISKYQMLDNKSNISYYVEGTQDEVEKLGLVLNVYNDSNVSALHEQLVNNASVLSKQALKYDLTEEDANAIRNGANTNKKVTDKWKIEVAKNIWDTKQGYDVQFIIKQ